MKYVKFKNINIIPVLANLFLAKFFTILIYKYQLFKL